MHDLLNPAPPQPLAPSAQTEALLAVQGVQGVVPALQAAFGVPVLNNHPPPRSTWDHPRRDERRRDRPPRQESQRHNPFEPFHNRQHHRPSHPTTRPHDSGRAYENKEPPRRFANVPGLQNWRPPGSRDDRPRDPQRHLSQPLQQLFSPATNTRDDDYQSEPRKRPSKASTPDPVSSIPALARTKTSRTPDLLNEALADAGLPKSGTTRFNIGPEEGEIVPPRIRRRRPKMSFHATKPKQTEKSEEGELFSSQKR